MNIIKGIISVILILGYLVMYLIGLPPLSFGYHEGFAFLGIGIIITIVLIGLWSNKITSRSYIKVLNTLITGLFTLSAFVAILGGSLLNASDMYKQIGEVQEKSFKEDILEIDTSQIPVVDYKLASKLADKKLGEDLALGSQMEVGEFYNKQQVNGKLVYVAPLEHRSFWKWFDNSEGTKGYIIVSATNPNDVKLVQNLNGKEIKLKYLPSAYLFSDLKRHIRLSGFITEGLAEEYNFELDDNGKPYWVMTTYKNANFWNNPEATGVITCDAQTGECKWYAIPDVPKWVDIVQPESFIEQQLENYGEYVHGIFNWTDEDKLSITPYITTIYNKGECYYYTGLSSVGKDDGTVGFVMVNTRNKSTTMYRMVGATENAAMRSAEGKVQHMGYKATTPIPINVAGIPTYFCTLKDAEGLVKEYAMLKIEDYSIVATGSNIMEAKRSYINAVNNSGTTINFGNGETAGNTYTGTVTRIGFNVENGNTYYYMILDGNNGKLYLASHMTSEELPITREGDKVKVSYVDENGEAIHVITFDNLSFTQSDNKESKI